MSDGAKPAQLTIDGIPQLYYSEVEEDTTSNDKVLETIPLGVVGHSDGTTIVRINGKSMIPKNGREYNFKKTCREHRTVSLGIRLAGESNEYSGRFLTVKEMSKVNDIVNIDWSFEARVAR